MDKINLSTLANVYYHNRAELLGENEKRELAAWNLPDQVINCLSEKELLKKLITFQCRAFWAEGAFPYAAENFAGCLQRASCAQELFYLLTVPDADLKGGVEQSFASFFANTYSVKDPQFIQKVGYGNQEKFAAMMHASITDAVAGVQMQHWDFMALFFHFAYNRYLMACEANMSDKHWYGLLSSNQIETWCIQGYEGLEPLLVMMHMCPEVRPHYIPQSTPEEDWPSGQFAGNYYYEGIHSGQLKTSPQGTLGFIHSPPDNLLRWLPLLQEAYQAALAENDEHALMIKLGRFFWLMCFAKPCNRGEVVIAEKYMKTIQIIKGQQPRPWKKGIIPWCEAVSQPNIENFANKFATLFAADPGRNE